MYNFIVNLFEDCEYVSLLERDESNSKNAGANILLVPPNIEESPIIIKYSDLDKEIKNNPLLNGYSIKYFEMNRFINPTYNNANNIGSTNALISHTPTHFKITDAFIKKSEGMQIEFPEKKIAIFEKRVKDTPYFKKFPDLCGRVVKFFKEFKYINSENKFNLNRNDGIVFLVDKNDLTSYEEIVYNYTKDCILKYQTFEGKCNCCDNENEQLFMIDKGNMFDIGKGRKFLLRHPTRYKTNIKSNASPENFNVCEKCALQVYKFFEYIKLKKYYKFIFPTRVSIDTKDYKNYSRDSIDILKMLEVIYNNNHSNEFDYVMMMTDPKIENIEFRYVNNFEYKISNKSPNKIHKVNVKDIPMYSKLKNLSNKEKENAIIFISNNWNKKEFLREVNLLFNNTLAGSLFETDPKNLIKSLPTFIKLKIIEYKTIIRNYIYFQDASLFENKIYSKLFREIISEIIINPKLRDEMKICPNKIRFFITLYYKYIHLEPNGAYIMNNYITLFDKLEENPENINIENEFEASYCMGQIFYYLLQESKVKNTLNLFTKYTLNVHNMGSLKKRLVDVIEKYSHNEYIDTNRILHNMIKSVLAFEFKNSYEDNKIPMYTGYFDNNYLYHKKSK